jgi:hypothetical protein
MGDIVEYTTEFSGVIANQYLEFLVNNLLHDDDALRRASWYSVAGCMRRCKSETVLPHMEKIIRSFLANTSKSKEKWTDAEDNSISAIGFLLVYQFHHGLGEKELRTKLVSQFLNFLPLKEDEDENLECIHIMSELMQKNDADFFISLKRGTEHVIRFFLYCANKVVLKKKDSWRKHAVKCLQKIQDY